MLTLQCVPDVQDHYFIFSIISGHFRQLIRHACYVAQYHSLCSFRIEHESEKFYNLYFVEFHECIIRPLQGDKSQISTDVWLSTPNEKGEHKNCITKHTRIRMCVYCDQFKYYYYLYLLYTVYSPVCPQTNRVPRGYTVAATLSFYCQYAVRCVSPSFLCWF